MQAEKFDLEKDGSTRLAELRRNRQALSGNLSARLQKTEALYGRMDAESMREAEREMSALDKGLEQYGSYKATIADLAVGLQEGLEGYVELASEMKNYQGFEKFIKIFSKQKADSMRYDRLRTQSPKENLQMVLAYGEQLHKEICEVREDAIQSFQRLQANGDVITAKIAEYQPQEEALKEQLDAMEAAYLEKEQAFKIADAAEQAKLSEQMNEDHARLTEFRHQYDQVFTVYSQAQQSLQANIESRDAFEQMVRDLGRQATMIQEKMDNIGEIYAAAPEAVKIMMTTKGMETLDKAMNAATAKSVDMITQAAVSVQDATQAREKVQLIDTEEMLGYMKRMRIMSTNFEANYEQIRGQARASQQDRYGQVDA